MVLLGYIVGYSFGFGLFGYPSSDLCFDLEIILFDSLLDESEEPVDLMKLGIVRLVEYLLILGVVMKDELEENLDKCDF